MALNRKELEAHAADLRRQIEELKALRSKLTDLIGELRATEILIERDKKRTEKPPMLELHDQPSSYGEMTIPEAVDRFFANGAGFDWYSPKDVADQLAAKMPSYTYESLRANVGMALKRLADEGHLERRNTSMNNVPRYAYRKKT